MKYINLIDKLTKEDKATLEAYINKFGVSSNFIGVDNWLQNWSHVNQKLYHLLGDSFIKEEPFKYTKSREDIYDEMRNFIYKSNFKAWYTKFYFDFIKTLQLPPDENKFFNHLMDVENFIDNKISYAIKWKKPNGKKILQIQKGTKPLKAIYRVIEYFKDDYDWGEALPAFEQFKKDFGIIISDKEVIGTLCISIHPMDYITMSDNVSNWSSCMTWKDDGCYHVGTIEMMNSNNVLCCYLTNNKTPFIFDKEVINPETGEIFGSWNNKKWRQLFYFNKDIIMGGKPYPYVSEELTKTILDIIKNLAKENLGYTYQFGPELYNDMVHVKNIYRMNNQKMWAKSHSTKKYSIIWDTKGMYNDMLNDPDTSYWCYRNKVNHTKVISVSGKANCLCCNNPILTENEYDDEYNERYNNTNSVVCQECIDSYFICNSCSAPYITRKLYHRQDGTNICEDCLKMYYICPSCGKPFKFYNKRSNLPLYVNDDYYNKILNKEIIFDKSMDYQIYHFDNQQELEGIAERASLDNWIPFDQAICCKYCEEKVFNQFKDYIYDVGNLKRRTWLTIKYIHLNLIKSDIIKNYLKMNLKQASFKDLGILEPEKAS